MNPASSDVTIIKTNWHKISTPAKASRSSGPRVRAQCLAKNSRRYASTLACISELRAGDEFCQHVRGGGDEARTRRTFNTIMAADGVPPNGGGLILLVLAEQLGLLSRLGDSIAHTAINASSQLDEGAGDCDEALLGISFVSWFVMIWVSGMRDAPGPARASSGPRPEAQSGQLHRTISHGCPLDKHC